MPTELDALTPVACFASVDVSPPTSQGLLSKRVLAFHLLLLCLGCASDKKAQQTAPAGQIEQPYQAAEEDLATGLAALRGSWTANAEVKGYGMAKAVLILDSEGEGSYYGSLSGAPHNGTIRVSFWDGEWLQAEVMGYQKRVLGKLTGDQLRLELPYAGSVVFYRAAK